MKELPWYFLLVHLSSYIVPKKEHETTCTEKLINISSLNLFWGLPKWEFLEGKKVKPCREKIRKSDVDP